MQKRAHPPCSFLPHLPFLTENGSQDSSPEKPHSNPSEWLFSSCTIVFTSLWASFSHLGLNLSNPTVLWTVFGTQRAITKCWGWMAACSLSGESERLDMASTWDCIPVVVEVEVEAGNYICMWSTDTVWGTVIIGDLDLQKHFFQEEPLATYNEWLYHFTF